jgi:hypothetical protein
MPLLLVTSIHLDTAMLDALDSSDDAERCRYLAERLDDQLGELIARDGREGRVGKLKVRREFLSLLLSSGRLRLKIAIPVVATPEGTRHRAGIHHEKLGLIGRRDGSAVSFVGSINETMAAWDRGNYESIDVFSTASDPLRVHAHAESLASTWSGAGAAVKSYDISQETSEILRQYLSQDIRRSTFLTALEELGSRLPGPEIEGTGVDFSLG